MNIPNKERNGEKKERKVIAVDSFDIKRWHIFDNGGVSFDMELNGIGIYGCRCVQGRDGNDFISFPQRKGSDGKYYNIVYAPLSDTDQKKILSELERKINE